MPSRPAPTEVIVAAQLHGSPGETARASLAAAGGRPQARAAVPAARFGSLDAAVEAAFALRRRGRRSPPLNGTLWNASIAISPSSPESAAARRSTRASRRAVELCARTEPGEIRISGDLARAVTEGWSATALAPAAAPARREPQDASLSWRRTPAEGSGSALPGAARGALGRGWGFIGRASEIAAAQRSWSEVVGGGAAALMLSGEPGAGKTRLMAEVAAELTAAGAQVGWGSGEAAIQPSPYEPLRTAIGDLIHASPAAGVGAWDPEHRWPAGPQADDLYPRTAELLDSLAEARPVVLALEDLHLCDEATLRLMRYLLFAGERRGLLVIGSYRPAEAEGQPEIAAGLAELEIGPGVELHEIGGLDREQALSMAAEMIGEAAPERLDLLAETLIGDTAGNPLLLTETLRNSSDLELWTAAGSLRPGAIPAPRSIRRLTAERVARLGADCEEALAAAAVDGAVFDAGHLSAVSGLDATALERALERGEQAGLINAGTGSSQRYAFSHALVATGIYESLPAPRRGRLHRRWAEALEAVTAVAPERLARHWFLSSPPDPDRASRWAELAAHAALEQLSPTASVIWFRRSLESLDALGDEDSPRRCRLMIGFGRALFQQGRAGFRDVLLGAARLAERLGEEQMMIEATLANGRGFVSASGEIDRERIATIRRALAATPTGGTEEALLLARWASELSFSGDLAERIEISDRAVSVARSAGDGRVLAEVLTARFVPSWVPRTLPERLEEMAEAVELAAAEHDPWTRFGAVHWHGVALVQAGRLAQARTAIREEGAIAEASGDPTARWISTYDRANLAIVAGRHRHAEELAGEALAIAQSADQPDAVPFYASQMLNIRWEQGRMAETIPLVEQAIATNPGIPAFRAVLALAYAEEGRPQEAHELLEVGLLSDFGELPEDVTWLAGHAIYAHVAAELGERRSAAILLERLAPWRGQIVYTGISAWGDVDHAAGRLQTTLGQFAEAEASLRESLRSYGRIGAPIWAARAKLHLAVAVAGRLRAGDLDEAADLARAASREAERLGAGSVERAAQAWLGANARRLIDAGAGDLPDKAAALGLTAREIEVARRLADGMTNREIAESLALSPSTIKRHLEKIYAKVGVKNRAGAIAALFS